MTNAFGDRRSPRPAVNLVLAALCLSGALLIACRGESPSTSGARSGITSPAPDAEAVRIPAPGGAALGGRLYGRSATNGVVLVPDPVEAHPPLDPLARELATTGAIVLTFDLPPGSTPGGAVGFAQAAAAFLRDRGVEKIVLVGEGSGGTAALAGAATERVSGVATLSAPAVVHGTDGDVDGAAALARIDRPVLFMASLGDADRAAAAQRLYDAARDPRSLALVPGTARGAAMLAGQDAAQTLTVLRDFLRQAYTPLSA